ncbi:MAG: phosphodiesterase [Bacillota bacterium]|nr:phosphodiesterase [Bacillota bacterium]
MKLMVASDLHGSANYVEQLLQAFQQEQAERLLLLGDLLYHGPRNALPPGYETKDVASQLNGIREQLLCVRGNCDAEVDQMVLDFPIDAEYCILWLGKRMVFATHGHRYSPENPPQLRPGDILLTGHTHIPACRREAGGFLYVNPGSVSIPKGGSEHSYIILEEERILWKTLKGNVYREYPL